MLLAEPAALGTAKRNSSFIASSTTEHNHTIASWQTCSGDMFCIMD